MKVAASFRISESLPGMESLEGNLRDKRRLMAAQAKRVELEFRSHFKAKDAKGNKRGWPRTHFWSRRIMASTSVTKVTENSAEITIAAPEFAQKLFGGTIVPIEAKRLAIPVREEAAGKSPRTFGDRFKFGIDPEFGPALVDKSDETPFYKLVRRVTQKADPSAAPGEQRINAALMDETARFLQRRERRAGGAQ